MLMVSPSVTLTTLPVKVAACAQERTSSRAAIGNLMLLILPRPSICVQGHEHLRERLAAVPAGESEPAVARKVLMDAVRRRTWTRPNKRRVPNNAGGLISAVFVAGVAVG